MFKIGLAIWGFIASLLLCYNLRLHTIKLMSNLTEMFVVRSSHLKRSLLTPSFSATFYVPSLSNDKVAKHFHLVGAVQFYHSSISTVHFAAVLYVTTISGFD